MRRKTLIQHYSRKKKSGRGKCTSGLDDPSINARKGDSVHPHVRDLRRNRRWEDGLELQWPELRID